MKLARVKWLILFMTCWQMSVVQAFADVYFTENGFVYSSLLAGQQMLSC